MNAPDAAAINTSTNAYPAAAASGGYYAPEGAAGSGKQGGDGGHGGGGEAPEELKQALIDSLYGTERGLKVSSETRGEVAELIAALEAANPTPAPTEDLALLGGKWLLAYTSFSELFPLLATGNLPFVTVGEISQTIDPYAQTVVNAVQFSGPVSTTSFSARASFELRSPKRVQIKFEEGVLGTPQLVSDSTELPSSTVVLGQSVDLRPFQSLLRPLQGVAEQLVRALSGLPPLRVPIGSASAESWLLTTYLDKDLRIARGDGGSVFVLVRAGSPLTLYT
eukprot:SM000131S26741  [mRNA]  locus=s131:303463:304540:+ [translate_table: standard]